MPTIAEIDRKISVATIAALEAQLCVQHEPVAVNENVQQDAVVNSPPIRSAETSPVTGDARRTLSLANIGKWTAVTITSMICLTVLLAIAIPCFGGSQQKFRTSQVRGNMRTVQIAAESYAMDNHGVYPSKLSQLGPYLPGGSQKIGKIEGLLPVNPIHGSSVAGVVLGANIGPDLVQELRTKRAGASQLKPGQVSYSVARDGTTYAVVAADSEGFDVTGATGLSLVLSNI